MSVTRGNYNRSLQLTNCRVVDTSNLAGTYFNGPANDGVQATLTTAAGTLTIDSVLLAQNDSVLLQNQSSTFQNGIYFHAGLNSAGNVVLQRRDDFQSNAQMVPGLFVPISAGTTNHGTMWMLVEPAPVAIGTDAITFIQV